MALTLRRVQSKGLVRTTKKSQKARGTHKLSRAEQGIYQDSERKSASEWHSLSVERRARDLSVQRNNACLRGALTNYRGQGK
jgi:DNA-binding transcriptional regulator PaaX